VHKKREGGEKKKNYVQTKQGYISIKKI